MVNQKLVTSIFEKWSTMRHLSKTYKS